MKTNNDLISKDIKKLIFQIAIPSSVGLFFNTMYNVVDTYFAGTISTEAIAALSYSFMVYFLFLSVSFGVSSAMTVLIGNALGRHKKSEAKLYVANGLGLFFMVSLFLIFIGFICVKEVFILMGAKSELDLALEYTYIILLGIFPMLLGLGINAVLIALGDTKSYRNTLILGFFLNIILTPLFLYGINGYLEFGFKGIAISTVLIQFINLGYMFYKLHNTKLFISPKQKNIKPNIKIYKNIFHQGYPISLNMFMMSFGTLLVTSFVASYGYESVAAFGIGYRVEQIVLLPMLGLNTAVATLVANNYGAKNLNRINEIRTHALKYGYIMSTFGLFILVLFGKYIIAIFDDNPTVIDITYTYIVFEGFILYAYITLFISTSTLQGIKKPFMIPIISFYRQLLMPTILLYIVVYYFTLPIIWVWIAMTFIIFSAAIFMYFYTQKQLSLLRF